MSDERNDQLKRNQFLNGVHDVLNEALGLEDAPCLQPLVESDAPASTPMDASDANAADQETVVTDALKVEYHFGSTTIYDLSALERALAPKLKPNTMMLPLRRSAPQQRALPPASARKVA